MEIDGNHGLEKKGQRSIILTEKKLDTNHTDIVQGIGADVSNI